MSHQGFPDTKIGVIPTLTGKGTWDLGFKSNYGALLDWGSSKGLKTFLCISHHHQQQKALELDTRQYYILAYKGREQG